MSDIYSRLLDATKSGRLDSSFVADLMPEWASSMIHWSRLSKPKKQALSEQPELGKPGLYVWLTTRDIDGREADAKGDQLLVPRKVGQTGAPPSGEYLLSRMQNRYVTGPRGGGPKNQVPLALKYQAGILSRVGDCSNETYCEEMAEVQEKGLKAFPSEVLAGYNKNYARSQYARYKAAVDWVLHGGPGLASLYVVVAPVVLGDAKDLPVVEKALQSAAESWNLERGLPSLYNR